jgi:uncharacterized protein YcfL
MKKLTLIVLLTSFIFSCCSSDNQEQINQQEELNKKIELLSIKLEATEAQLLNINIELSKCIANRVDSDSVSIN